MIENVVSYFSAADAIDITAETETPLVSHCKMDASCTREILRRGEHIFDADEWKAIKRFINRNNRDDEPMTLLLKRAFTIQEEYPKRVEQGEEEPHLDRVVSHKTY